MVPINWDEMFAFSVAPVELIIRGTMIYWFIFLVFRFIVRRDVGSIAISDILVLVLIADASQNAMANDYKSISDGLVLISTIVGWDYLVDWMAYRFQWFRNFAEPRPICLVRDGRVLKRNLRKELITEAELMSMIRQQGIDDLHKVHRVYMERNGEISVIRSGRRST